MSWSVGFLATLSLLLFWSVGAYNRLMRLRGQTASAYAAVDKARLDDLKRLELPLLEPESPSPSPGADPIEPTWEAPPAPLVSMDPAVAKLEAGKRSLRGSIAQVRACLAVVRGSPLNGGAVDALMASLGVLDSTLARWAVDVQDAPSAPPAPDAAPELAARLRASTDEFNASVSAYNEAVGQFPAVLLAWMFGFRKARHLLV